LWVYSAHVHMVLCARWQEQRVLVAGAGAWTGNVRSGCIISEQGSYRRAQCD
jgi:hypothetical protein